MCLGKYFPLVSIPKHLTSISHSSEILQQQTGEQPTGFPIPMDFKWVSFVGRHLLHNGSEPLESEQYPQFA